MATRIISVLNQKGGVGKTTTCVNLGAALARRGQEVLLLDMDPQANLTVHVGTDPRTAERTTYSLLLGKHELKDAIRATTTAGLGVVPSTLALANAEIQLASAVGRELILRESLNEYLGPQPSPKADFVLIDCPPSLGILTMNALCASTDVLLPIQAEFFALQGVAGILESLKAVQRLNRGLRLSIVVPCMVDKRKTLARDVIDEVRRYFGPLVTQTCIRVNVKLAEAPSHGKTIFEYDASSNGAKDYASLAAEVLGDVALPPDDDEATTVAAPISAAPADAAPAEPLPEAAAPSDPPAAEAAALAGDASAPRSGIALGPAAIEACAEPEASTADASPAPEATLRPAVETEIPAATADEE